MSHDRPIDVIRKDGTLVPKQRWLFDQMFAEGQEYTIEIHEPRSDRSHRHYFAVVREAWKNLPEDISKQHPDAEHLRKFALIKCGWSIKRNVVCETVEMAHQVAAMAGALDESAVILVQGTVVTIATARSQKTTGPHPMDRADFQLSKQQVIDYCASLIGVDPATLSSQIPDSSDASKEPPSRDRPDTPAASGPHDSTAAGVTNSNSSGNHVANERLTDAPPGSDPDKSSAGGAHHSEASLLSADWRDVYVVALSGVRDKAASLLTRHAEAIQMIGGDPNEAELAWMRKAWRLVQRRNEAKLKRGEFDAELEKLKSMPLSAAQNAA